MTGSYWEVRTKAHHHLIEKYANVTVYWLFIHTAQRSSESQEHSMHGRNIP